ncbi:hypothetical protein D046_4861A, partial [Vibrio parahaemolyticus V-223/04]
MPAFAGIFCIWNRQAMIKSRERIAADALLLAD